MKNAKRKDSLLNRSILAISRAPLQRQKKNANYFADCYRSALIRFVLHSHLLPSRPAQHRALRNPILDLEVGVDLEVDIALMVVNADVVMIITLQIGKDQPR
jgi:hypothetical protein